jgi:hypothetical protein
MYKKDAIKIGTSLTRKSSLGLNPSQGFFKITKEILSPVPSFIIQNCFCSTSIKERVKLGSSLAHSLMQWGGYH